MCTTSQTIWGVLELRQILSNFESNDEWQGQLPVRFWIETLKIAECLYLPSIALGLKSDGSTIQLQWLRLKRNVEPPFELRELACELSRSHPDTGHVLEQIAPHYVPLVHQCPHLFAREICDEWHFPIVERFSRLHVFLEEVERGIEFLDAAAPFLHNLQQDFFPKQHAKWLAHVDDIIFGASESCCFAPENAP